MLRENMVLHNLNTEWIPSTYNIQVIFDDQIAKEKRQVSLSYAMERIGEPALEAHDALNDARNTVCICLHLDMVKGLAEYAALHKQMKCYGSHAKERSQSTRTYSTREATLNDSELINFFVLPVAPMLSAWILFVRILISLFAQLALAICVKN